jgi:hypothetical protein
VGVNANWFTWPGSANVTSVAVPINPANPAVFFRLVYPGAGRERVESLGLEPVAGSPPDRGGPGC